WKTISTYSSFIRLGFDTTMQTAGGHVHSGIQPDRLASGTAGQLPLRQDDLVMANDRRIYAVGQGKARVHADLRISGRQVFFYKQLKNHVRNFNSVERHRIDMHEALTTLAVSVGNNFYVMNP